MGTMGGIWPNKCFVVVFFFVSFLSAQAVHIPLALIQYSPHWIALFVQVVNEQALVWNNGYS